MCEKSEQICEGQGAGTIGALEAAAGITDRSAFWVQFAGIKGTVRVGHKDRDASFEAGVAELRRRIGTAA